jgi:hypothetical protein
MVAGEELIIETEEAGEELVKASGIFYVSI